MPVAHPSGSGGLLERMAAANPDIISIDQSVDIVDGIKRVGSGFAIQVRLLLVCGARTQLQLQGCCFVLEVCVDICCKQWRLCRGMLNQRL